MASSIEIEQRRDKVKELMAQNFHPMQIAEKLGVHISTVYGDVAYLRGGTFDKGSNRYVQTTKEHPGKGHSTLSSEQIEQIGKLSKEGFSGSEIARKLELRPNVVYYHTKKLKEAVNDTSISSSSNGAGVTSVNHDEEAKVAYIFGRVQAELEHYIERAGLPKAATSARVGKLLLNATRW